MGDYNLELGEFVIMQQGGVNLLEDGEDKRVEELVLTNRSLIFVKSVPIGIFKRERRLDCYPLKRILRHEGAPQVMALKVRDVWRVQVVFDNGVASLNLGAVATKRESKRWAEAIASAATGSLSDIRTEPSAVPEELQDLADMATGVLGAFFGVSKNDDAAEKPPVAPAVQERAKKPADLEDVPKPAVVNKRCRGCHAPLTGEAGKIVVCAYCDTKQRL